MKRWVALPVFIGLMASSCTAATNPKPTKYQPIEEPMTVQETVSPEQEQEIKDLKNRIEALERNFIDVRMDYISRINNLEVEIAELKEENAQLLKMKQKPEPQKIARIVRKKAPAKKEPAIIAGNKQIEESYDKAIQGYKDGDFKGSLDILNNLIIGQTAKNLQDNIYYWRGMCQFQLSEYQESIKNFTTVIENYPKENKYYDSKLMVAISHGMLGEKSLAINELTRLLEENIPEEVRSKANKSIQEFQK